MLNPSEKRHFDRITTERPISIQTGHGIFQGKMLDLSENGTGIITPDAIEKGENISVKFSLPALDRSSIELEGITIHAIQVRNQYLIGVKFTNLPIYMQSLIAEFIRYHRRFD